MTCRSYESKMWPFSSISRTAGRLQMRWNPNLMKPESESKSETLITKDMATPAHMIPIPSLESHVEETENHQPAWAPQKMESTPSQRKKRWRPVRWRGCGSNLWNPIPVISMSWATFEVQSQSDLSIERSGDDGDDRGAEVSSAFAPIRECECRNKNTTDTWGMIINKSFPIHSKNENRDPKALHLWVARHIWEAKHHLLGRIGQRAASQPPTEVWLPSHHWLPSQEN